MTSSALVRQAVILAGGQGSRLRPYTDTMPKAMIEIGGQRIIDHQLAWLAEAGVTDVVVSAGHLHEVLAAHLESAPRPVRVRLAVEPEPLGRGGGLKFAGRHLPDHQAPWFALNGDIWTDFSLPQMAAHHEEQGLTATIALVWPRLPWGVVDLGPDREIVGYLEAPPSPYPINGGVYVFTPQMMELLPDVGDHERSTFPELAKQRRLAGYRVDAFWRAIDTPKDVREATAAALGR